MSCMVCVSLYFGTGIKDEANCRIEGNCIVIGTIWYFCIVNTLKPRHNGRHFADDIFSSVIPWVKTFEFYKKITEMCFLGSNWQYDSNGSDNGLAPKRWQPIIWTNVGVPHWRIFTRPQSNICAVFAIGALSILQTNSTTASRPSILCNYTVQASGRVLVPCELLGVTQKRFWLEIKYQRVELIISIENTFYFTKCITITDDN